MEEQTLIPSRFEQRCLGRDCLAQIERGVINQPEVLYKRRCVLRGCVGVPVVGMPLSTIPAQGA